MREFGVRMLSEAETNEENLGPLFNLRGTWRNQGKFTGWNIISVPAAKTSSAPDGFDLEVIPYSEELIFEPAAFEAKNKGVFDASGKQLVQDLFGLRYRQTIKTIDTKNKNPDFNVSHTNPPGPNENVIHAENGFFFWVNPNSPANPNTAANNVLIRLASIPHGNSVLLQGSVTPLGATANTFISANGITAPTQPKSLSGTPIPYGADQFGVQIDGNKVFSVANQQDPDTFLQDTLVNNNDTITSMQVLAFDSKIADSGILNIPFLQNNVTALDMTATFWIETLKSGELQLQYSQSINLRFPPTGSTTPIVWPHVTINTLRKG